MDYIILKDYEYVGQFIDDLSSCNIVSMDTELDKLDHFYSTILLIQMKLNNHIYILDCRKAGDKLTKYIVSLVKESNKLCIFHNAKFDIKAIKVHTGEMLTHVYDTMNTEILLYQGLNYDWPSYADLCSKYCNVEISKEERNKFIDLVGEITPDMYEYSAIDVEYLLPIMIAQEEPIKISRQEKVRDLENKVVYVTADMELNGVLIDVPYWLELEKKAIVERDIFEKQVLNTIFSEMDFNKYQNSLEVADALKIPVTKKRDRVALQSLDLRFVKDWLMEHFNVGSSNQMKTALNLLGVPVPNTNEKTLAKFRQYPIVDMLLNFREHNKKIDTYGSNFLKHIHPKTGRVHSNLEQLRAATGRYGSSDPNLQNIPKEQSYRRAFIARKGYKIIAADFSQQEFRLVGAVSGDRVIIDAYKKGLDMHIAAGGILYDIELEKVEKPQRTGGKTFNFAAVYGTSKWGLSKNMKISMDEAEKKLDKYWSGFPDLAKCRTRFIEKILECKYSVTPLGRRRYFENRTLFEDNNDRERYLASMGREGFNHIIQGGSADITKIAMCKIYDENPFGEELKILLQIHDELLVEVREDLVDNAVPFVIKCMEDAEQPFLGEIPAKADYAVGDYWIH